MTINPSDVNNDTNLDDFAVEFFSTNPYKKEAKEEKIEAAEEPDEDEDLDETEDEDTQDQVTDGEDEGEDDDDGQVEEPEPKPKKKSVQERINELTAKAKEAERALATERADNARRIEDLERKINPPVENRKPVPQELDGPTPDDKDEQGNDLFPLGEFDPAYIRALAKYTIKTETEAAERFRQERVQQEAIAAARETQRTKWVEQIHETSEDIPDLVEKITSVTSEFTDITPEYGQYLIDVIQSLDNGTRVLAYLADNAGEARKIVNSGIASATVALGRLDARVAKTKPRPEDSAPARVTKTKAAPPRTVRGNSGRFQTRGDTDDLDAFAADFFRR